MAQYIDKSALVAEIERLKNIQLSIFSKGETQENCYDSLTCISVYNEILSFIDALEVKEVDSEKVFNDEYSKFSNDIGADYAFPIDLADFKDFARHFFELGMSVSNKAQKGK